MRVDCCRIGGSTENKVDIAGADFPRYPRLLTELCAGELVDDHRAVGKFQKFGGAEADADAVTGIM
jgi:hypothetical protein